MGGVQSVSRLSPPEIMPDNEVAVTVPSGLPKLSGLAGTSQFSEPSCAVTQDNITSNTITKIHHIVPNMLTQYIIVDVFSGYMMLTYTDLLDPNPQSELTFPALLWLPVSLCSSYSALSEM